MSGTVFRVVLLVSLAHALVHIYELSLPAVEQMIGNEFDVGPEYTGPLGTAWRLPFGLGALLAGWLADRLGSKRMLLVYLVGCAGTAALAWWSPVWPVLFASMFAMGCFASIYHPAGLALISRETTPVNRGAALGWHGILGSVGIAAAPFMASLLFTSDVVTWRQYYLLLVVPGLLLAILFSVLLRDSDGNDEPRPVPVPSNSPDDVIVEESAQARWGAYFLLVASGALFGFIYAALMHFLPRYLDTTGLRPEGATPESFRNLLAALVLICGAFGQGLAGWIARPQRLNLLLIGVLFANVPCLLWMAVAQGEARLWATCATALVHFMNQPIYNSLIALYVPRAHRSTGYGFSNMMCFGVGAFGPGFAGLVRYYAAAGQADFWTYGTLAAVAFTGGVLAILLSLLPSEKPAATTGQARPA